MKMLRIITNFFWGTIFILIHPLFAGEPIEYKIIIDPGHGGNNQSPYEQFGDKYDTITQKYLEKYKPGASYKDRHEREIVLQLGKELKKILDLTQTPAGFEEFKKIVRLYSGSEIEPVRFHSKLTREDDYSQFTWKDGEDQNGKYRMYDFPDPKTGKRQMGRLSWINSEKPYLVVSLHLNPSYPGHPGGMAAVIAPPYSVFQNLRLISMGKAPASSFKRSPYSNWLQFVGQWTHMENAMADTWIYFHGYWPDRSGKNTNLEKFSGYRQNMVTWKYSDKPGWEEEAKKGGKGPYSKTHSDFIARGDFWNRERSQPEKWRRSGGPEGFGGDNLYASNELLRFVQYGLQNRLRNSKGQPPKLGPIQPPYISTYSLPTYTNAICAFLEIGYIDIDRDMKYIQGQQKIVAESLAVGIYSLFKGLKTIPKKDVSYRPKGKKVPFGKYESWEGKNYFKIVSGE